MSREKDESYVQPDWDDVIEEVPEDETFVIGQCYEARAATTLSCKKCKGVEFKVGSSNYYTAIKCIACNWQLCIHNG